MVILLKILSYLIVYFGGVASAFSQGWVKDYYKRKKELREKLDRPYHLLSDIVSEGTSKGYSVEPKQFTVDRGFKVASRIESLGKNKIAADLREYLNKWKDYSSLMESMKEDYKNDNIENVKRSIEIRERLDELVSFLLSEIASEHRIIPKLRLKTYSVKK